MGKNLYENPRDRAKWNVSSEKPKDGPNIFRNSEDARKERLEQLKKQYKKKRHQS